MRKHAPEVQYLRATISEEQRQEFGRLVETTVNQIEAGHFNPYSGIRFPQNGCMSCPHLGLCLHNDHLATTNLVRRAGASSLNWLDKLVPAVSEEFNHRRAVFLLGKVDEILSWERAKEQEKDARFVELGEYLCEVRAKQYWRLENLRSFDEFAGKEAEP